jgi:hypothetical protein
VRERRHRDERGAEDPRAEQRPRCLRVETASTQKRDEPEGRRPESDAPEPRREQEIEQTPFDDEPDTGENGHDRRHHGDGGIERETGLGQRVRGRERVPDREERGRGGKQRDEQ